MKNSDLQIKIADYYRHRNDVRALINSTDVDHQIVKDQVKRLDREVSRSFKEVIAHGQSDNHETRLFVQFIIAEINDAVDDSAGIAPLLELLARQALK